MKVIEWKSNCSPQGALLSRDLLICASISGQSFREETRLPDGSVKGQYGYLDAQNKMRIVKYTAGLNGFSIDSDTALNEQQIAASRPTAPNPQYQAPPAAEQPRQQYNPQQYSSARQSFQGQGLAQAAQQQYQAYLPPPTAQAQQPYTGYSQPQQPQYQPAPQQAPQAAAPQYTPPQYSPTAYGSASQLTPAQLQAQALACKHLVIGLWPNHSSNNLFETSQTV